VAATKGAPSTTRPINAALFKQENGKYHFALYHTEGGVFQRGEGFTKVKDRDAGLQHVPRLRQDSIFFDRIERDGCFMDILNNEDDREIARNCLKTAEAKAKSAPDSKAVPKSESKARKTDEVYKDELYGFKSDHLQLVEGIGPKINQLLNADGIVTWRQLSRAKPERLREILTAADPRFQMHNSTCWLPRANFAADGRRKKMIELQKYHDMDENTTG